MADLKHSIPVCKPHLPTTVFGHMKEEEGYYSRTYREQFSGTPPSPAEKKTDDAAEHTPLRAENDFLQTVQKAIDQLSETDRLRMEIDRLKVELRLMNAELNRTKIVKGIKPACTVCCRFTVSVVFVDCKHACCCSACAEQLNICPICRAPIQHSTKVIFS
jgi:hypothetical protein